MADTFNTEDNDQQGVFNNPLFGTDGNDTTQNMQQPTQNMQRPVSERSQPPSHQQLLVTAAHAHYQAQRTKAFVNLNNYFENPSAIGEHPDIVNEIIKIFEEIDHAESVLETIQRSVK